jgi:GNAT superfamily N-acetyltransferase
MIRTLAANESLGPIVVAPPLALVEFVPVLESQWAQLLTKSGEFGEWDTSRLKEDIVDSLLPGGAALLSNGGELIGCAAACDRPENRPFATLMYVVILSKFRGSGLAEVLLAHCANTAIRAGYNGIALQTDAHRIPAIKSYLKHGFIPDERPCDTEAWKRVFEKLRPGNGRPMDSKRSIQPAG